MDIESNRAEIEAWLLLLRAPGLGASRLRELVDQHGSAVGALDAVRRSEFAANATRCRDALHASDKQRIADDVAWLAADTHLLLTADSADFPPLLRDAPGAPAALFVIGDATALWRAQVAIVGSRNASHGGLDHARSFASALCAAGLAITSGLAEGIDAAAHTAALDAGAVTVAVLGTGPDVVFPLRHRELASRIAENGALVSEFPPGTPGRPENFPRRNRIIAGLALGTLVVEAGLRSGSLITARCAADQGREVFAIPGSIHNPLARGCHRLIRQGATLVETADEVIAALGPIAARLGAHLRERLETAGSAPAPANSTSRDAEYEALLAALAHEAHTVDALIERTGIGASALSSMLLMLELEGEVVSERGGLYARRHLQAREAPREA